MPKSDPNIAAHLEWLGFVRPTGLVVSAPALAKAGAVLNHRDVEGQNRLRACVQESETQPYLPDFRAFARSVLGWRFLSSGYAGTDETPIPSELEVNLPDYAETLRPTYAVRERNPGADESPWQLLVQVLDPSQGFDRVDLGAGRLEASPHGRMERLLRATAVPAGLLFNGHALRLISAPHGESSGWMDFEVADMLMTAGRPICTALRLLLNEQRLLALPQRQRLAFLLKESRKYQNEVSERLSEQVLHALYELLRGFQAAHDASHGVLLQEPLREAPDDVYQALLTVILRLVFLLYAEERDMLPEDETFVRHYSIAALYERLRDDAALYPDTMDQRYGAWAQLLVLFRMIHDGAAADGLRLPQRHGALFDPDRFKFLEGRTGSGGRQIHERIEPPLVPDGTMYRALEKLFVLDGERISYRALDVEQIGSVYETMMGFRLEIALGRSAAIKAPKKHGAPTTINLEELLNETPAQREKWVRDRTDRRLPDKAKKAVKAAATLDDLHLALDPVLDKIATPDLISSGAMVLQPSEARRRSGSHYTPRALTEPIVRTTLEPILKRLRGADGRPRPEQILDLKVCDFAMGSGAFLVETCRQLAEALIGAWDAHGGPPVIPPDEDETIYARRLVAQRCIYGVDRNPVAVDLAKLSLWLVTLAKDHPLTFLDHALRHGDSLVGLSCKQIEAFHWKEDALRFRAGFETMRVHQHLEKVADLRRCIREAGEEVPDRELQLLWKDASDELDEVTLFGDLVLAAFFEGAKPKQREAKRAEFADMVASGNPGCYRSWLAERREEDPPFAPFHWELEFPEVFERENSGFDAVVGNPPFLGGTKVSSILGGDYLGWILNLHRDAHGNADLVAHFFRRAFNLIREDGTFGLIATNTIAQGDTRSTGLRWICEHGGEIYQARRRVKWPGVAAVVVSVLHVFKTGVGTPFLGAKRINDEVVKKITAFLFHRGGHNDPVRLGANTGSSFTGNKIYGQGFTFDDTDKKGVASSLADMQRLIEASPRNREAIFPYIGGEEVNTSPTHKHRRYVINFRDWPLRREDIGESWADADVDRRRELRRQPVVPHDYPEPVAADWPELLEIVEERVKPERAHLTKNAIGRKRAMFWWQYGSLAKELYSSTAGREQVLANSQVSTTMQFAFLPSDMVYAHTLNIFPFDAHAAFSALQSRCHEIWVCFFGSSLGDGLRYTSSDCFETFPFPENWETHLALEAAGKEYYEFRAALMVENDEGLTKTYNRFHNPSETDSQIAKLRDLHAAMDRAVLDAYGWRDITPTCEFLLDYEIDEEEWGNRKKPYRYRWPDAVRDEVLARLLELNAQRAAAETRAGAEAQRPSTQYRRSATRQASMVAEPMPLWETSSSNSSKV